MTLMCKRDSDFNPGMFDLSVHFSEVFVSSLTVAMTVAWALVKVAAGIEKYFRFSSDAKRRKIREEWKNREFVCFTFDLNGLLTC